MRLALKELKETLRDRRTMVTLLLMPLLVYPLLSVAFQKFLMTSLSASEQIVYNIGIESEQAGNILKNYLELGDRLIKQQEGSQGEVPEQKGKPASAVLGALPNQFEPQIKYFLAENLRESVQSLKVDVGVRVQNIEKLSLIDQQIVAIDCELLYPENSRLSEDVLSYIERRLRVVNQKYLPQRLKLLDVSERVQPIKMTQRSVESIAGGVAGSFSLSTLVPLILILMTITGAVYPAIDLTAGERERGTLEMLIAAPVPRLQLLLAKYVAVLTVALLTATVNLTAMTVTIMSVGLGSILFGEAGLSGIVVVQIFALLILFAAFFSAVLLALTSFARSFKEAQAYLIPLILVSLAPGMLSLIPGLRLNGFLAVMPLANIVLLSRDLFENSADGFLAITVVVSTVGYALIAIAVAGWVFGADAILYGSHGSWSDLFRKPIQKRTAPSFTSAMFCLAVLFPAYLLASNFMGRLGDIGIQSRLTYSGLLTVLLFLVLPSIIARVNQVEFRSTFSLSVPKPVAWPAAILLGLSLWPIAFELVIWAKSFGVGNLDPQFLQRITSLLEEWHQLSPVFILLALAVTPAVCEEFFFRGYLLSALRTRDTERNAILLSGLLFGLFHLIVTDALALERFIPSTLLGMILGWVCCTTGSLYPGIVLHACHNGFLLMVSYYQDQLAERGWGIEESSHLPIGWIVASALISAFGLFSIHRFTRRTLPG